MPVNFKSFIQYRKLLIVVTALYLPVAILLCSIVLVNLYTGVPLETFTRDPAAIAGINPFTGIVSNIGILLWCIGASISLFSFFNITKGQNNKTNDYTFFLLFFGLTTLVLLLDDLLLFHELIAPTILNISEKYIYACYGTVVLFGMVRFRKVIFQTEWIILGLAFIFFALSIAIDLSEIRLLLSSSSLTFLEDSFKLLGIASWAAYFVLTSFQIEKRCRR